MGCLHILDEKEHKLKSTIISGKTACTIADILEAYSSSQG
jgi:hypothetical protein